MNEKYYCSNCKGFRNHTKLHETIKKDTDDYLNWKETYLIIECNGCENVSFAYIYEDSQMVQTDEFGDPEYFSDVTIYPYYLDKGEELKYLYLIPNSIQTIYKETISSFKANAFILTAGGFRAIIEEICNHLKIKKENLSDRIDNIHKKGYLTLNESKRLHSIRFLGNDALHEMKIPKKEHLQIVLEIINHLLENLFIQDKKIEDKIEVIIDTYDKFLLLIKNKITKEQVGKKLSLDEIMGNSKRLIKDKGNYGKFERALLLEIKNKTLDFLTVAKNGDNKYEIIKKPSTFDW